MRFGIGSIPILVDLDIEGSALQITHPYPYSYPLRPIKEGHSMEEGRERILVVEQYRYSIKLRNEVGGKEDLRAIASSHYM